MHITSIGAMFQMLCNDTHPSDSGVLPITHFAQHSTDSYIMLHGTPIEPLLHQEDDHVLTLGVHIIMALTRHILP